MLYGNVLSCADPAVINESTRWSLGTGVNKQLIFFAAADYLEQVCKEK